MRCDKTFDNIQSFARVANLHRIQSVIWNDRLKLHGRGQNLRHAFSLEEDSRIRIYAIGEGMGDEMYDYAWIENAETGQDIWKMTYRDTEHAGGARKNR